MQRMLVMLVAALLFAPQAAQAREKQPDDVRFATFNASLNRPAAGNLVDHLSHPEVDDVFRRQARNVAEVIQRARPDVLLINEFDFDPAAADLFRDNFLEVSQNGAAPITYPYAFVAPSNTGIPTGKDLDNNGKIGEIPTAGNDAFGFGDFPGQYGMVVYSKYPIDKRGARTFQHFLWKDMPGNRIPTPFYSPDEVDILRLSSKSHWDVPIRIDHETVHFLVAHPTPPVFDGTEDRNGRRNFDEIRFWADYISAPSRNRYIYDDDGGRRGGLEPGAQFVIAGDQNSDPLDGDSIPGAAQQLLDHPLVNARVAPTSAGAVEATALQGGANATHRSDPKFDTADFTDGAPGNLRADYVLPRRGMEIEDSAVFWPVQADPLFRLTGVYDPIWTPVNGFPTSDHRLVWADIEVDGRGHR
ncbi:MAG TPA: endonuclease/exonuclease/phosphatase family protein [Solirubrobacteraceae bacterium]|nr:endonuclease/exonuclease/phosphatase family protein [Solirubrobacteraceae bacterium]